MRRSAWLLPIAALAAWLLAVAWPALAVLRPLAVAAPPSARDPVALESMLTLITRTALYSGLVTLGAVALGWAPGRLLAAVLRRRGFVPVAMLLLLPICLPAYVVFYMWWQAWPADSALHAWAVRHDLIPLIKRATLVLGLVCWSWPLVAWCVAGSASLVAAERAELLRLDAAGPVARLLDRCRTDARGIAVGALVVFLLTFTNTTCFDLAGIMSFGNELRAADAEGAAARAVIRTAAPVTLAAAGLAALVWFLLDRRPTTTPTRTLRPSWTAGITAALTWAITVAVPLFLLATSLGGVEMVRRFATLYRHALVSSVLTAAVTATLAVVITLGLALIWLDDRPRIRAIGHLQALGWIIAGVIPATVAGIALESAYNITWPGAPLAADASVSDVSVAEVIYRTPAILVLGYLARAGFVGALLARWAARREPKPLADLRRVEGALSLPSLLRAAGPRLLAASWAAFAIVFVLSLAEIPVTARVHPPGSDPLALALLNAMHYQRPETVMVAALGLVIAAAAAAAGAALLWRPRRLRTAAATGALLLITLTHAGCDGRADNAPLDTVRTFGSTGIALGQFCYPRCLAVDRERELIYIIDKTARIQRFGFDGIAQHAWSMPARDNGKPTGVGISPEGNIYVADTHYYRIIAYTPEGEEFLRFGTYGEGPGEFVYPTDVAFGPDGTLYVAEYGGHDRVQVFNAEGEYLFEFGSFGEGPDQFTRPQSLAFNHDRTELYIADSCNHRLVVTDPRGNILRTFGQAGIERGEFHYPYGIMVLPDETLIVSEFGNNRIQHLTPTGESLGLFGRLGSREGELRYPWGVDGTDRQLFVLDSGNNRVQMIRTP